MADTLFVRLGSNAPDEVTFVKVRNAGDRPDKILRGPVKKLAEAARECRVVVVVPASEVVFARIKMPMTSRGKLVQAVPFAMEEQMVTDVDKLHFAIGTQQADGTVSVAVVAMECMERWRSWFEASGVQADVMVAETQTLPLKESEWSLLHDNSDTMVLRTGMDAGLAFDVPNLLHVLIQALDEAGDFKPDRLMVFKCDHKELPTTPDELEVKSTNCGGDAIIPMATGFNEQHAINLLQGNFAKGANLAGAWRKWLPAAAVLMLWIALEVGTESWNYIRYSQKNAQLNEQIEDLYQETFPKARNIIKPRLQMEQKLVALRGSASSQSNFLHLLAATGASLKNIKTVKLKNISYKNGQMIIDLVLKDAELLDQIEQQLGRNKSITVKRESATARNNKVEGRLRIGSRS